MCVNIGFAFLVYVTGPNSVILTVLYASRSILICISTLEINYRERSELRRRVRFMKGQSSSWNLRMLAMFAGLERKMKKIRIDCLSAMDAITASAIILVLASVRYLRELGYVSIAKMTPSLRNRF